MPRKRIIDPEYWSDEEVGSWTVEARLFYIGLWNFADDEGFLKAHPLLLKSQIFPYDTKLNIDQLKTIISNKVYWYEINGQQYGQIINFLKHQRIDRPSKSHIPRPLYEDSTNTRRPLTPEVKLSKDNINKPNVFDNFESVWTLYPNKIGKSKAHQQYKKLISTKEEHQNLLTALSKYKSHLQANSWKKAQDGKTWFGNWRDWVCFVEPIELTPTKPKTTLKEACFICDKQVLVDELPAHRANCARKHREINA